MTLKKLQKIIKIELTRDKWWVSEHKKVYLVHSPQLIRLMMRLRKRGWQDGTKYPQVPKKPVNFMV